MRTRTRCLCGLLVSLALVIGLMPGVGTTAYAVDEPTGEVVLKEDFENCGIPTTWSECHTSNNYAFSARGSLLNGYAGANGSYMAGASSDLTEDLGAVASLSTPTLDLADYASATLSFSYANTDRSGDGDGIAVGYKIGNGDVVDLGALAYAAELTETTLELPNAALVGDVTIVFTATCANGYGVGVDDVKVSAISNVPVTGVTLNKDSTDLTVGDTETLTASVLPDGVADKTVTWFSDDTGVATVNGAGVVTAVGPGTATITATSNADSTKSATCAVAVSPVTYTVTYKVVNGTWSNGKAADITETVASGAKPASVPTGMKAKDGYAGGAWDTDPAGATITGATTFTYTFTAKRADAKPAPARVEKPSASGHPGVGTLDVSWKSAQGAESYEVQWRKAGGKWQTKATKSKEYTVSGLKKGALYEVHVRAKAGTVAGEWSSTARHWLRGPSSVKAKAGAKKGSIKVSWNRDKKATGGFKVYVYAKRGGKLVKTAAAKAGKRSVTVKGLKSGKKYFVRVEPIRKASGATYNGALSGYRSVRAAK